MAKMTDCKELALKKVKITGNVIGKFGTFEIEQVFVNLIENAVKYAKEDSSIILDYEIENEKFVVSVKNEYDIIPREKLKTLFEKFTRVDDSTTRTTRGTGLGLYIVKGLVEAMNGEIRLYSNEECGFCVKVYMPISQMENAKLKVEN